MRASIRFLLKRLFLALFITSLYADSAVVVLETSAGEIELTLFPEVAPKAVENFTTHVKNGYYDGTIFHRIIKRFMIQGGDPTGSGMGGESIWGRYFEDEIALGYAFDRAGLLAMANAGANSNGSQFFITTINTPWLNGKHTIFGEVSKGFDVLRRLESAKTDQRGRPIVEQKIFRAYLKER